MWRLGYNGAMNGSLLPEAAASPAVTERQQTVFVYLILYGTVAAGYLTTFIGRGAWISANPGRFAALVVLGILFTAIYHLSNGNAWLDRRASALAYFAVQIVIGLTILLLAEFGNLWIIILPLSGQTVALGRNGLILLSTLIFALVIAVIAYLDTWENALRNAPSLGILFAFVALFSYTTYRAQRAEVEIRRLAGSLAQANEQLREYAAQVEELAITRERNRLAREIHDSLGHYLTVVNVQLDAAQLLLDKDVEKARTAMTKAQQLAREGLTDVRRSVAALREGAGLEHRPVGEALADLIAESNAAGIAAELQLLGNVRPLPPQTALTLYRSAQEALTNVRKHARASRVDLRLDFSAADQVTLTVRDNGVGAGDPDSGFGLLGMRERVQLLQGQLTIDTAPGKGFCLNVRVPG